MHPARAARRSAPILLALIWACALFAQEPSPVTASLTAAGGPTGRGQAIHAELELDIGSGWHIYGPSLAKGEVGLPTTLSWDLPAGFTVQPIHWPALESFTFGGVVSQGYTGRLVLPVTIVPPKAEALGPGNRIGLRVDWLVCKDVCMPGKAELSLSLPAAAGPFSLALALALAFVGGLILNLMPCVLPVLSLKALSLAKRAGGQRPLAQGLYFTAGVLVSFWLFAAILLALRAGGAAAGWGFQLQNPVFVAVAALVFFLMGLSLFGVFELGVSLTRLGSLGSRRSQGAGGGAAGAFATGFFATAVATPCTAPFMGVAIGYALSHGTAAALGVFTFLGLGMAAPLFAISAFPALAKRLPRSGAWMLRFRQALGFPLMAAVVWMGFVLAGLGGTGALLGLLEGMIPVALGAWLWGAWGSPDRTRPARIVSSVLALLLIVAGLGLSLRGIQGRVAAQAAPSAPKLSLPALTPGPAPQGTDAFWKPWSEGALAELRGKGVPVFVDFSAAWCLSCQVNEALALDVPAVRRRFAELGVTTLKADWTARDEAIGRGLAALGRASVPLYVLYPAGSGAPVILPEILTPGIVLGYLDRNIRPGL